jgi:hypothetical protein
MQAIDYHLHFYLNIRERDSKTILFTLSLPGDAGFLCRYIQFTTRLNFFNVKKLIENEKNETIEKKMLQVHRVFLMIEIYGKGPYTK